MAETLTLVSVIVFVISGLSFALAIFFWFFFKIPSVIGDLTGKTARKNIAKIRAENEKKSSKAPKDNRLNFVKRKSDTGSLAKNTTSSLTTEISDTIPETGLLETNKDSCLSAENTALLFENQEKVDNDETAVLVESNVYLSNETTLLSDAEGVDSDKPETYAEETGLLIESIHSSQVIQNRKPSSKQLVLLETVMYVHTDEVIEC